jgi:DNA-binding transcriptional ArsR family regulator
MVLMVWFRRDGIDYTARRMPNKIRSTRRKVPAAALSVNATTNPSMPVYWVMRRDQLNAVASAIRHDILDHLVARGPLSVHDLAQSLHRKPTAIYSHLQKLLKVDLVVAVRVSRKRGRPTLLFRPVAPRIRLAHAPNIARNRPILARIARTMSSQAAADYGKAFQHTEWTIDGPARNHWVFRCMTAPSVPRLAKINRLLDQLAELIWTPDPKPGRLMSVTWLLSPIGAPISKSALGSKITSRRGRSSRAPKQ